MRGTSADYDDNYATCARTYGTLCIYHDDLDPEAVSSELGLLPTEAQVKGVSPRPGSRPPARVGAWFLSSQRMLASRDVRRHIDWLLELLEPRADALKRLQKAGCKTVVSCYWQSAFGHGGPMLTAANMLRMANLGLEIWFDIYWLDDGAVEQEPDSLVN